MIYKLRIVTKSKIPGGFFHVPFVTAPMENGVPGSTLGLNYVRNGNRPQLTHATSVDSVNHHRLLKRMTSSCDKQILIISQMNEARVHV